jgi:hypothetical protein
VSETVQIFLKCDCSMVLGTTSGLCDEQRARSTRCVTCTRGISITAVVRALACLSTLTGRVMKASGLKTRNMARLVWGMLVSVGYTVRLVWGTKVRVTRLDTVRLETLLG